MEALSFSNVVIAAAVAFGAPFVLGLVPGLRVPAVVLEILAGIVLGPDVLGVIEVDLPGAAMVSAGMLSVLLLPIVAAGLFRGRQADARTFTS